MMLGDEGLVAFGTWDSARNVLENCIIYNCTTFPETWESLKDTPLGKELKARGSSSDAIINVETAQGTAMICLDRSRVPDALQYLQFLKRRDSTTVPVS